MFKKIVWATDGSSAADAALAFARGLVEQMSGELVAVHVEEVVAGPRAAFLTVNADEPEARDKIRRQVADLQSAGITASEVLATRTAGGAAHAIVDAAEQAGADLIVVGTRGHTALTGLLLGSVTQRLLHISGIPVLAIPPASAPASP